MLQQCPIRVILWPERLLRWSKSGAARLSNPGIARGRVRHRVPPTEPSEDEVFGAAIERHGNVILGGVRNSRRSNKRRNPGAQLVEFKPADRCFTHERCGLGTAPDGEFGFVVCRAESMMTSWKERDAAIWLAALRSGASRADEKPETERWINFFYGSPPALDRVTLERVLQSPEAPRENCVRRIRSLRDSRQRCARFVRDAVHKVWPRVSPGVEVLANACANLVRGDWLSRMGTPLQCLLVTAFGVGAVALLIFVGRGRALFAAALLLALVLAVSLSLQWHFGLWWNWLVPALAQLPSATLFAFVCPRLPTIAFISYRREGGNKHCPGVAQRTADRGYDAISRCDGLGRGRVRAAATPGIERAPNFMLVLSPGAFDDRINRKGDWLRRGVYPRALVRGKTIIRCWPKALPSRRRKIAEGMTRLADFESIPVHASIGKRPLTSSKFLRPKKRRRAVEPETD